MGKIVPKKKILATAVVATCLSGSAHAEAVLQFGTSAGELLIYEHQITGATPAPASDGFEWTVTVTLNPTASKLLGAMSTILSDEEVKVVVCGETVFSPLGANLVLDGTASLGSGFSEDDARLTAECLSEGCDCAWPDG